MEKKRFIEKFIENKKVPNETFTLNTPDGEVLSIDLESTVKRIYEANQGFDVKKLLKKGQFRNATHEQCLKLFEGAAQRFLMDDFDIEVSKRVQDILGKAHRRKDSLFIEFNEEGSKEMYEVLFIDKDERKEPYVLRHMDTKELRLYDKKGIIEFLMKELGQILQVI